MTEATELYVIGGFKIVIHDSKKGKCNYHPHPEVEDVHRFRIICHSLFYDSRSTMAEARMIAKEAALKSCNKRLAECKEGIRERERDIKRDLGRLAQTLNGVDQIPRIPYKFEVKEEGGIFVVYEQIGVANRIVEKKQSLAAAENVIRRETAVILCGYVNRSQRRIDELNYETRQIQSTIRVLSKRGGLKRFLTKEE